MARQTAQPSTLLKRFGRAALLLAGTLVSALSAAWLMSRPANPDAFYEASPPSSAPPGILLRSEPFARTVPAGALAWRILYTTTRIDNSPAVASATVVASARAGVGPRPVIAWAHGTTGIARGCAPSVMARPFAHVPAVDKLIGEDWIYVATDYVGLGTSGAHAYLVGDDAARAVLDAVRATRSLRALALDNPVVVWGHSQGGNSALWTGMRAPTYAPDVKILGIAAFAPASDLPALLASGQSSMFGKIVSSYVAHAYSAAYPEIRIDDTVKARARALVGDIATRCAGGWDTLFSVLETLLLPSDGIFARDPRSGPLGDRLRENTPTGPIAAPVLIAQGTADDLVPPEIQERFVRARCAAGQPIDYRSYPGRDHLSLVAAESPLSNDLIAWTRDRLAGHPASAECQR